MPTRSIARRSVAGGISCGVARYLSLALVLRAGAAEALPPSAYVHFARLPLSQSIVLDIEQDGRGFMWFATDSGVVRWDGYRARIFGPTAAPGRSVSAYTTTIEEDPSGAIWAGTDHGIWRYEPHSGAYTVFMAGPDDGRSLGNGAVKALLASRSGTIWAATVGLERIDPRTGRVTRYRSRPDDPATLSDDRINGFLEDEAGALWIATNAGLDRLDPATGRVRRYRTSVAGRQARSTLVNTLARGPGNRLWVGTSNEVLLFDPSEGRFEVVTSRHGVPVVGLDDFIRVIETTADGRVWFGTDRGLVSLEPATGRTVRFLNDVGQAGASGGSRVRALYADRVGALWIAPQGQAVCRYDPKSPPVALLRPTRDNPDSPASGVWAMAEDAEGGIWLATDGGVDRLDLETGRFRHFTSARGDPSRLQDHIVRDIALDDRGRVWAGTYSGGVSRIDPNTGRVVTFMSEPSRPGGLDENHVRSIYRDHRGLWIGTVAGRLHRYEPANDTLVRVPLAGYETGPGVLSMTGEPDGTLWLGTYGLGLLRVAPSGTVTAYVARPGDPNTIGTNTVWALARSREGTIWVGTSAGLDALDPATGRVRNYRIEDGLVSPAVRGIVEADDRAIWISTDRGLSRLDADRRTIRNYTVDDGIATDTFNYKAAWRTRAGLLCFGGPSGLTVFDPSRLTSNPTPPRIVLTDFQVRMPEHLREASQDVPGGDIESRTSVTLASEQYAFSIEFAALDFRSPNRNRYRYRLDGLDTGWVSTPSAQRHASYSGLRPGRYTFRVTGSNNDGVWSRRERALEIVVLPPWWRTRFAYVLYAVAGIGLVAGLVKLRTRVHLHEISRQRALNEELERRVAERTAQLELANGGLEAANRELEAFSYSVSHDLRAPLRAIDGFSRILAQDHSRGLSDEGTRLLGIVRHSTQQMGRLIDDLLAFSRLGRQPLSRQRVDMRDLVQRVWTDLEADRAGRSIEFVLGSLPPCHGDRALLRQVWVNLIGNALKFTRVQSQPRIDVGVDDTDRGTAYFVRDNGTGFDSEYAHKLFGVFQRLHRAEEYEGTGVGLAIVQRIVHRHGGQAWAVGEPGVGATFWFTVGAMPPASTDALVDVDDPAS